MNQELPISPQLGQSGVGDSHPLGHPLLWEHQALRADNHVCFNLAGSTLKLPFFSTLTAPGLISQLCYYIPELSVQGQTPMETGGELGGALLTGGGMTPNLAMPGSTSVEVINFSSLLP